MAETNVITALSAVQSKLKANKTQYNKFGGYAYRSCEDILEAVKPLLHEVGAVLTITDEIEFIGGRWYVRAIAKFRVGAEEIETSAFAREAETKKGMDDSQITGSASSYARKYALNGMFCIDDNKDADATNTGDEPKRPPAKPAQPEQLPAAAKKEPTLKERFDKCKAYFAKAPDASIELTHPENEKIVQGAGRIISELKQAGRTNEAAELETLVNSKLKHDPAIAA